MMSGGSILDVNDEFSCTGELTHMAGRRIRRQGVEVQTAIIWHAGGRNVYVQEGVSPLIAL